MKTVPRTAWIYLSLVERKLVVSNWYASKREFLEATETVRDAAFRPIPCKTAREVETNLRVLNKKWRESADRAAALEAIDHQMLVNAI